jgi:hypothetical protein
MLYVKTKIGPSEIEGIGLFADEFIPKDTIISLGDFPAACRDGVY